MACFSAPGAIKIDQRVLGRFERYARNFDFIVLDPLLSFFGASENDNSAARLFMNALAKLIQGTNKVILVIHHTGKPNKSSKKENDKEDSLNPYEILKNQIRGASAFTDVVRTVLYLKKVNDYERKIIVVKSNVSKIGTEQIVQMPFRPNKKIGEVRV